MSKADRFIRNSLLIVMLVLWLASAVDAFLTQNFTGLALITTAVTTLGGIYLGFQGGKKDDNKNDK